GRCEREPARSRASRCAPCRGHPRTRSTPPAAPASQQPVAGRPDPLRPTGAARPCKSSSPQRTFRRVCTSLLVRGALDHLKRPPLGVVSIPPLLKPRHALSGYQGLGIEVLLALAIPPDLLDQAEIPGVDVLHAVRSFSA